MAGKRILVDTSIIIAFLRSKDKSRTIFWKLVNDSECCVSSITFFELYAGATSQEKLSDLELLFNFLEASDFMQYAAKTAVEYRELFKKTYRT